VLVIVIYSGYRTGDYPGIILYSDSSFRKDISSFYGNKYWYEHDISYLPSVRLVFNFNDDSLTTCSEVFPWPSLFLKREIRLENITFSYPEGEQLFNDYNITIPANRITGITENPELERQPWSILLPVCKNLPQERYWLMTSFLVRIMFLYGNQVLGIFLRTPFLSTEHLGRTWYGIAAWKSPTWDNCSPGFSKCRAPYKSFWRGAWG